VVVFASLVNQYGFIGVYWCLLASFKIINNFSDNQYIIFNQKTIIFNQKRFPSFEYFYIQTASAAYLVYLFYVFYKKETSTATPLIFIALA